VCNGTTFATIEYATCCSIRSKLTLGNGCYTEYDYDDARRLTKITNKKSNGTVISSWEYAYDDVGNVTSQTDNDSLVTSYSYDDIYQLTAVDYPSGSDFGYEYDGVGNRLKMHEYTTSSTITTTYTYDNADELTQWTTSTVTMTFTYASDGCLVSKSDGTDTWTYDWDFERRLAAFKKNGATLVEYAHNPTGTRRQASDSTLGVENYFHHRSRVLGDYNSNWGLETSYILGANAMVDRTTDPDTACYLTQDRRRSTREILDGGQTVNTRYHYDIWSNTTQSHLIGSVSTRYRAGGLEYTAGHLYAKSKSMYDPGVGRDVQANFDYTMLFSDGGRYDVPGPQLGLAQAEDRPCCGGPNAIPFDPCNQPEEGYCEMWLRECRARCETQGACANNWHKALCYRCCQCYYKRCWTTCGREGIWEGPPPYCASYMSGDKCPQACWADDYFPPPCAYKSCDDEDPPNNLAWDTVCMSEGKTRPGGDGCDVCGEYGETVGRELFGLTAVLSDFCRRCMYRGVGFWDCRPLHIDRLIISVNRRERCPSRFPLWIASMAYYNDLPMWNSCDPGAILRIPQVDSIAPR